MHNHHKLSITYHSIVKQYCVKKGEIFMADERGGFGGFFGEGFECIWIIIIIIIILCCCGRGFGGFNGCRND